MSTTDQAPAFAIMRVSYERAALAESELAATWHEQLATWLADAAAAGLTEPNAMVLATADADGRPSSRTMLCKGLDTRGVVFYTSYASAKSQDLLATGFAAVTFPWLALQRQVQVRGTVERTSPEQTAAYWATRPRGSQLGAWASPQSREVPSRAALDDLLSDVEHRFDGAGEIPVPPHWGGWRIRPQTVEFWQGRQNRMHDRLVFELSDGDWHVRRLGP